MSLIASTLQTVRARGAAITTRAVYQHLAANVQRNLLGRRFIERRIHGHRMLLDLDDHGISRTLVLFGIRETEHKVMLERLLKPGMTVLDIGANIGYYTLMMRRLVGPGGKLIAVEPSPENIALLKRNLALNGYEATEVHAKAVSDAARTRHLFLSQMSNLNTFHETGTGGLQLSGRSIAVETTTVPELMAGRPLDLLRMDVEGHEVEVINGLLPAVERGQMAPVILFETHINRYTSEHDMEQPLRRLFALGYGCRLVGSSWERGTEIIKRRGYTPASPCIRTDGVTRALFEDISDDDAVELICRIGGVRTVVLGR